MDAEINTFVRQQIFEQIIDKYSQVYSEIESGKIISYLGQLPLMYESLLYKFLNISPLVAIIVLTIYFFTIDYRE